MPAPWFEQEIASAAAPLCAGLTVEVLASIDSTSSELMRRARAGATRPAIVVALRQTAGRGRLGRAWHSDGEAGAPPSLTFSLGLPFAPRDWSGLSLAVGASVADSLDPGHAIGIGLKWPNDLWVDERKLGGILIETATPQAAEGSARQLVIGIGLNLGPRPVAGLSTPPTWLRQWQPDASPGGVLRQLAAPLLQDVRAFAAAGFAAFAERFAARDVLRGREVVLSDGRAGRVEGVGAGGELLLRGDAGVAGVSSAEISVRPRRETA